MLLDFALVRVTHARSLARTQEKKPFATVCLFDIFLSFSFLKKKTKQEDCTVHSRPQNKGILCFLPRRRNALLLRLPRLRHGILRLLSDRRPEWRQISPRKRIESLAAGVGPKLRVFLSTRTSRGCLPPPPSKPKNHPRSPGAPVSLPRAVKLSDRGSSIDSSDALLWLPLLNHRPPTPIYLARFSRHLFLLSDQRPAGRPPAKPPPRHFLRHPILSYPSIFSPETASQSRHVLHICPLVPRRSAPANQSFPFFSSVNCNAAGAQRPRLFTP